MKTTPKPLDLKSLEVFLSKKLAKEPLDIFSVIVNCLMEDDEITILLQHSPPVSASPSWIFSVLKKILKQQYFTQDYQFNLSLAIYGEEAYANHDFIIKPALKTKPENNKKNKIFPNNLYIWLLGSGSVFIFIIIYMITRPCVIGECKPIIQAQELALQSEKLIIQEDLVEAQIKLKSSLGFLQSIPWFSSYYNEARELTNNYSNSLENLEQLLSLIKTGNQLLILSQKPVNSLQEWQNLQQQLQQAIKNLTILSKNKQFSKIAQNTIDIYQIKMIDINKIVRQEISAENSVLTASEIAQIAALRQEQAYSLEEWQLVNSTWQLVQQRLQQISSDNFAYQASQDLLKEYQPIIKTAADKLKQEEIANQTYQQAIKIAQKAKQSEQEEQYSLALENWNNALNTLSKISDNTSIFNKSQNLMINYKSSLEKSKQQLQLAQIRQKAKKDLDAVCYTEEKICTYTLKAEHIMKVSLNYQYIQKVIQIAMLNQVQGDLMVHIASVQKALEAISNKYKIPLEVYHADGGLIFTYSPNK